MGDFDACRFDFRIDGKNGLTPSKRKKGFKRSVYNTLFKCKVCSSLFENRPALLAHKSLHNEHQCTFCERKFKKKNHLREHVNIVHYIDKLKAGYKSEYGRSSSKPVSSDLSPLSSNHLPPLIPVSDIDQGYEILPSMDNPPETSFKFGMDAMATSSPVNGSQSFLQCDMNSKSATGQGVDLQSPTVNLERDHKSPMLSSHGVNNSEAKFPEFTFASMASVASTHLNLNQGTNFPQSALQSAMASFYPFNHGNMLQNTMDDNDKLNKTSESHPTAEHIVKGAVTTDPLKQSSDLLLQKSPSSLSTVIVQKNPGSPNMSSVAPVTIPSLIPPLDSAKQLRNLVEPAITGIMTNTADSGVSNGIPSMSKINLGQLLTTPPIPDLSVLTSVASNKLNISSANPMSLLPRFPTAASFPILSTVGPSARTAVSDQAVTSITPSSLQTVMAAPVPTSVKQSLPVIRPKPNGLPQNPFKPICTVGSTTSQKKTVPITVQHSKPLPQAAATQISLLKSSSLPPVAPVAPPPNIFRITSNASSSSDDKMALIPIAKPKESAAQVTFVTSPNIVSVSSASESNQPLPTMTPLSPSTGLPVSLKQPQTPVPTPSPNVISPSKPLPPPASLASLLTGIPLQAGVPPGLSTMQGSLPPGYMMMTLVLTTQPGGGVAAVPVIPGYSYPGMTSKMNTQSTPSTSSSGLVTLPAASQASGSVVPPVMSVVSSTTGTSVAVPQLSSATPRFSLLHPQSIKPSSEIEPGEITKSQHMPAALAVPQKQAEKHGWMNNPSTENRYFLNLAPASDTEMNNAMSKSQLSSNGDISMMSNMTADEMDVNKSRESTQMDISYGSSNTSANIQPQVPANNVKSNKRKQSFPAKNTQVKKQQTLDDVENDTDSDEQPVRFTEKALDLSAQETGLPVFGEDSDRVAMLDQYHSQGDQESEDMMDYREKDKVSSSMVSGDTCEDKHTCEQCGAVCENVYTLNKHRARVHTVKKGLTKMVDRLWRYKKDHKSTSDENISQENTNLQAANLSAEMTNILQPPLEDPAEGELKPMPQNCNNNNGNISVSLNEQPSTPIADPEDMISDTAKQVYIQMMSTGLKMLEDGESSATTTPPLMSQIPIGANQISGPLKVSECETGSGTFGHYRIKKPRFDDYCTFKFHTCKVCKQLFNTAEQMWEHALIHKELQRFKCSAKGCGYSSASREKLLQHKAITHPRIKKTPNDMNSATVQPNMMDPSDLVQIENLNDHQNQPENPMDEFTLLGQQQHYPCEFDRCDSVFFSANELMKHVDRVHQKLQCPEIGCSKMFYTMGGLKSHQMCHLEEDGPFGCTVCLKLFSNAKELRVHKTTKHGGPKVLECPLCQYSAKHRSSMNWHMKSRHNLDKVMTTKMGKNQTMYKDAVGNMVCSSRTDRSAGLDLSESSSGDGETACQIGLAGDESMETDVSFADSSRGQNMRSVAICDSPSIAIETQGQGVEIVKNEPEELSVGDNNTIATNDGTVLGPSGTYSSELVYADDFNESDQPLDFSMKKPQSNNESQAKATSPKPNASENITNTSKEEVTGTTPNKTPVGIVQPFVHLPSVSQGVYIPQLPLLASGNHGNNGDVTPPLPQLVPMANPFISGFVATHQQLLAMQSGGATGAPSPMNNDAQFFSFKLNSNNNNITSSSAAPSHSANKKASGNHGNKRSKSSGENKSHLDPITFACSQCGLAFECAEIMWHHKLQDHKATTNIYCDTCTFETKDQSELQSHMMSTHGKEVGDNKTFMCFICGKGYSSKLGLNHHLMRHAEGGPPQFPCPYRGCDSVLHSRGALGNHVKRVHLKPTAKQTVIDESKQVFYCDYPRCDRSFRESKHLRVHRMTHTDEKPLKCHLCEYSCRQRNSMNWHMKSKHGLEKKVSLDGKTIYV